MGKSKPRTKPQRPQMCSIDNDECYNPWANRCERNRHKCIKEKMKFLASLSDKERERFIKNPRNYV